MNNKRPSAMNLLKECNEALMLLERAEAEVQNIIQRCTLDVRPEKENRDGSKPQREANERKEEASISDGR